LCRFRKLSAQSAQGWGSHASIPDPIWKHHREFHNAGFVQNAQSPRQAGFYRYGNPSDRGVSAIRKKLRIRKILPNPNSPPYRYTLGESIDQ
jgi:hypothetical protein